MYCLDTSSLLEAWRRSYPPEVFPGLWEQLDRLIEDGRLWSSEEVLRELEKRDDDVYAWAKERDTIFLAVDDAIQDAVREILSAYPRFMGARANKNHADPFVVATAMTNGIQVITEERHGNAPDKPRIPDVCDAYGVPFLKVLDLIQNEGWKF